MTRSLVEAIRRRLGRSAPARAARPAPTRPTKKRATVLAPAATASTLPAEVQVLVDHVDAVHATVRAELDVLRQTRGQREVGSVKVPAHLRAAEMLDDSGVEKRATILAIQGPKE